MPLGGLLGLLTWAVVSPVFAWSPEPSVGEPEIVIGRAAGPIAVDGELGDPGWRDAARVDTWYETRPGDNAEPKVENAAWLAYDDEFFYAAFEFHDPEPGRIRAPLGDRDNVPSYTDYGGVILDTRNDGKTAQMFLANPRGIQYDAISSDVSGEDSSPDFFWDSAGRITARGWVLEMRIPFSSLRYGGGGPQSWRVMLYRNYPRDFRYQMFTNRLPRDSDCFICNARPLVGLEGLPGGDHWVAAPYVSATRLSRPAEGPGTPLEDEDPEGALGADFKWLPDPETAIDATINPDFSQVESDVAQIAANERFALFFPEKRPFFLESIDLFSTPIQALYTRTFTSPRWGGRATGELGGNTYTVLVGEDRGGGLVILPGSNGSSLANQDFESLVAVGRARRDFGQSFVSFLYSGREIEGGGSNRVLGPDFRWKPNDHDTVEGQLLYSFSDTPVRRDLADEWDGRDLAGHAAELWWYRQTRTWDYFALYDDLGEEFRADNGFVPRVGYRRGLAEIGRTFWPEDKPVSRIRLFTFAGYRVDQDGRLLDKGVVPGFGLDAVRNGFVRFELAFEEVRGRERVFSRRQVRPTIQFSPSRIFSRLTLEGRVGDEIDFANDRLGEGATILVTATLRPTDHLELALNASRRWLDVEAEGGLRGRLFTADVARLKGVYTFSARSWLRVIGQWVETERRPELFTFEVDERSASFGGSAVLAYKLNWQTVAYLGYGDNRLYDAVFGELEPADRQLFLKVSYAVQR